MKRKREDARRVAPSPNRTTAQTQISRPRFASMKPREKFDQFTA